MRGVDANPGRKTARKAQVREFYEILGNPHDRSAIPSVLHDRFTFRGSLGDMRQGRKGVAQYVDRVHTALGEYRCEIEVPVEERERVFAKMRFGGVHRIRFLGIKASGKRVDWSGCALFTFLGEKVTDLDPWHATPARAGHGFASGSPSRSNSAT